MELKDFRVNETSIRISKNELKKWKDFYFAASRKANDEYKKAFFVGKADAFIELLKYFDGLKG